MAFESRLELTVDSRSGEKRLRSFEGQLERTESAGKGLSRGLGMVGAAVGALGAAVGGFTVSRVINEAAQFEDSMLGLQAVSGATAGQMAQLEDQARTLGATSMFSAQQAGQAQRFLAQAGFEVNEVMSATPGILDLATAGQMNLAQAADIASNVLGGMRLEVGELSRVNDVLAATAGGANTSISQLGQALSTAAPLAASAGVSIEETAAAIGTLSDAGVQASRAGTGLQGVFRQLSNVTPQAEDALSSYGLSMQDVNIEANGLGSVLETLREANISTSDAFKIFGSEAGAAAQILISGADRVDEFSGSLRDSEGAAQEMALTIGSGLSGSMRSFTSALSESVLQLGDSGLSSAFQSVTDTASGLLSVYNGMLPEFAEANDLTESQAGNLQTMASALEISAKSAGVFVAARLAAYLGSVAAAQLAATQQSIAYQAALARMAGVSRTAAAAQTSLAAATRAASGALALVGGPLGLLVGGAGLLYVFRDELNLTGQRLGLTSDEVEAFRGELDDMSMMDMSGSLDSLNSELEEATLKAATARDELNRLRQESEDPGPWRNSIVLGQDADERKEAFDALATAKQNLAEIEQKRNMTRIDLWGRWADSVTSVTHATDANTASVTRQAQAAEEAARQAEKFASSLMSLEDRLFPVQQAQREFRQDQILLQTALMDGQISVERYLDAWQRLEQAQRNSGSWQDTYDSIGQVNREMERGNDFAKEFGGTMSSALEDAIVNFESLGDVAKSFFEDLQRMLIRQSVTDPLAKSIGGFDWGSLASSIGSAFAGGGGYGGSGWASSATFANGGYTGDGGRLEPAGTVHRGEFVVKKSVVDNPGVRPMLERLNKGYADGGYVGPAQGSGSGGGIRDINITVPVQAQPGATERDGQRYGRGVGNEIKSIVRQVIANEMAPRGMLQNVKRS